MYIICCNRICSNFRENIIKQVSPIKLAEYSDFILNGSCFHYGWRAFPSYQVIAKNANQNMIIRFLAEKFARENIFSIAMIHGTF